MESQSAAIQARELTKRFGEFTAVDHVTFEVRRGELFGLLGPNGAGKTTLSRMLTTLIVPSSGRAFVAGFDVEREPGRVREAIGVIPQALTSDLDLTGWENVDVYGGFYNLPRRLRRERAQHLIHMVGLTERANDLVQTYSGGMRRRLEIARGLIHSPEVLFLDEPTIGLDPQSRRAVHDLLEALRKESEITISLTTHYMDEAESLCDRIAIVDGGKIIALDTPIGLKAMVPGADRIDLVVEKNPAAIAEMLKPMPYLREVNLDGGNRLQLSSNDGAHAIPKVLDAVERAGDRVTSITVQKLSLEDVFIHFTGRTLRDEPAKKVSLFVGAGMPQQR